LFSRLDLAYCKDNKLSKYFIMFFTKKNVIINSLLIAYCLFNVNKEVQKMRLIENKIAFFLMIFVKRGLELNMLSP